MTWPGTLSTKTTGQLVDADDWNDVVNAINSLGDTHDHSGDDGDGAALALPDANYDSGWFAVTTSTTYTKAHGLSGAPRHIEVYHAAVASPGAGDEIVRVTNVYDLDGTLPQGMLGTDGTNIYAETGSGSSPAAGTVYSTRRDSDSGYYRILAWE